MKLFIIVLCVFVVNCIRVPVLPEKQVKLSAPYGGKTKQIYSKKSAESVSSAPVYLNVREVLNNGKYDKRNSGNEYLRHDNPERKIISFLPSDAVFFRDRIKNAKDDLQRKRYVNPSFENYKDVKLREPEVNRQQYYIRHDNQKQPTYVNSNFENRKRERLVVPKIYPQTIFVNREKQYADPRFKNYRDDKLHEPVYVRITSQSQPSAPISDHELVKDVPTKPIYPGEGIWAKKGIKHYPHVANVKYTNLPETNEKSQGHEIFEDNEQVFAKHQQNFEKDFNDFAPQESHNTNQETSAESPNSNEELEELEEESDDDTETKFVPLKTYSQVRKTENEEHLPQIINEPRLREAVKDSKIITVYTEEGYEDSAYDHEGHEKKAENSEGYAEKSKQPRKTLQFYKKEIEDDATKIVDKYFNDENKKQTKEDDDADGDGSNKKIVYKKFTMQKGKAMKTVDGDSHERKKRFVNDFPEITIDTDFIKPIPKHLNQQQTPTANKYPYYHSTINKNSALRYAENLSNVPVKIEGEMSFYEHADKTPCAEVERDINPIPEKRITQAETEETGENQNTPKTPRLGSLGEKIDCYKAKYFGEEPLDSPFFQEEIIEQPIPIFDELQRFNEIKNIGDVVAKESNPYNAFLEESTTKSGPIKSEETSSETAQESNSTTIKNSSAIVVPDYYDESLEAYATIDSDYPDYDARPFISHEIKAQESKNATTNRSPKVLDLQNATTHSPARQNETLPETLPYRMWKRPIKTHYQQPYPSYNVFDVNPYIPTATPAPKRIQTTTSKYKTISEVYYKNEIKPDEQLNVFADVINIIKNSTRDSESSSSDNSEPVSVKLNTKKQEITTEYKPRRRKKKNPPSTTTEAYELETHEVIQSYYHTSTTRPNKKKASQYYDELMEKLKENQGHSQDDAYIANLYEKSAAEEEMRFQKLFPKMKRVPVPTPNEDGTSQATRDAIGLTPPIYEEDQAGALNTYHVIGMKPPPKIRPITYAEYKLLTTNKIRRKATFPIRRRYARDISNRMYASIRRNKDEPDKEEEEDDYEPDRNRSFHYDEKTGKIVYDKKQVEEPVEYEEVEEEEEIDYGGLIPLKEPLPLSKKRTTTEGPPTTPGIDFSIDRKAQFNYLDYINKLKSEKNYVFIPDPSTTERGATTPATTPTPQAKTTPPEFLNILSKLHSDSDYKEIKDKKSKTTEPPQQNEEEEEDDDENETPLEGIQNSPGGNQQFTNLQIFDISEYLPQVKTYTPRTTIDVSKYKTIDRSQTRHNLSSNPSEEEADEANKTAPSEVKEAQDNKGYASIQRNRAPQTLEPEIETENPKSVTTTIKPRTPTTSRRRTLIRNRTRQFVKTSTTTTPKPFEESTTTRVSRVNYRKPTRVFPRRQRVRIHTTQSPEASDENTSKERIQRRVYHENDGVPQQIIPMNHKQFYTPIVVPELNHETQIAYPRAITPEIVAANLTNATTPQTDVEVFANYDTNQKHGGNYKKETEVIQDQTEYAVANSKRLIDAVPKPFAFYSDARLPDKINLLTEPIKANSEGILEYETKEDVFRARDNDYNYEDEVAIRFELPTKKPLFIKDPSKRLYFYAPI